jgi:hypothetical protein
LGSSKADPELEFAVQRICWTQQLRKRD